MNQEMGNDYLGLGNCKCLSNGRCHLWRMAMADHLTIREIERRIASMVAREDDGTDEHQALVQLLATMQREAKLREALEEISQYTSSQPAALNAPEEDWQRMRATGMERIAREALRSE